jgi:VCBS repeat-containing protein
MTTTNFHSPQPESFNLRANLLNYLAFSSTVNDPPVAMDDGVVIFFEDFENGYGAWSMEDLWNQENEADTCGAMVAPFPSPSNAAYFGQDGICTYDTDYIPAGSLTLNTPVTLPPNSAPHLKFDSYEQTEDACGEYDFRYVEVSADGGTNWDTLGYLCTENAWYEAEFDLSAYSGGDILLRFRFNSGDGSVDGFFGWMVDDIAIATSEPFVTDENNAFNTPSVLDNDFDPNLDPLFVDSYDGSGLLGTLVSNGDGTFLYDPNGAFESLAPGEQASEVFSYVVTDGVLTDTASVTVIVTGVDDTPVTVEDYYSSPEDVLLDVPAPGVLANDYDPEGDPFAAELASLPAVGDLTFNADGSFTYAPLPESSYVVTFTYVISYGEMYGPQDTFFVGFGEAEFPEGTPVDGHVVTTLDGLPIPPLSFEVVGTSGYMATFTMLGPLTTTYNIPPNIEGSTLDTLYIDLGTDVDSAGFSFVLSCPGTVTEAITVTAYAADMSPVGTYFSDGYDFGYGYSENWVDLLPGTPFRSLQIDLQDLCSGFVIDNLTYQEAVAAPTLVTLNIFAVNDAPVADDLAFATDEDTPFNGMLTAFDIEGDPLGFSLDSGPAHGAVDIAAGGGFTYTPDENYNGADSFTFMVSDGDLSDGGQVDITINPVNDDPIVDAGEDQQSEESAPVSFAGTFSDSRLLNPQAVEIAWDFGDGETASGTLTPTHTYADDGDYTVTLVITDELGAAGTDSLLVSVANVEPLLEPIVDQDVEAGQQLGVTAFLSDPGWMDSHTLDVDWGDGITETIVLPYGTQEFDLSHAFTEVGIYTVSVTVTDDDGGTHAITFTVNVSATGYWTFLPMTQK